MKAVILARVSTKEQEEEGISLDAQIDRLREYCKRKGLEVIKEVELTESSTQGKRKGFYEAFDFIKEQECKIAVVVDAVDRLQRGFKETPMLNDLVTEGRVELHFCRENIIIDENSTSSQKLHWDLSVLMAKSYVCALADNVRRSFHKKLEDGTILGQAPIGYLNTIDERGKPTVVIDPERGFIVKKIFDEYAKGLSSFKDLQRMADKMGLKSRRSGKCITAAQIHELIQNPFYYGVMRYKGKLYPHIYSKLISKEVFDLCQDIRQGRNTKSTSHSNTQKPFIFRGLVRCKHCGRLYSPEIKKGKYIYLRPAPIDGCDCKPLREEELLKVVEETFDKMSVPPEMLAEIQAVLKKSLNEKKDFAEQQISLLRQQYDKVQRKIDTLLDVLLEKSITKDVYDQKSLELRTEQANIRNELARIDKADEKFAITLEYIVSLAARASELFKSSKVEEKRQLIKYVFSNFEVEGKNIGFSIRKPFDKLLNLSKGQEWLPLFDELRTKYYDDVLLFYPLIANKSELTFLS